MEAVIISSTPGAGAFTAEDREAFEKFKQANPSLSESRVEDCTYSQIQQIRNWAARAHSMPELATGGVVQQIQDFKRHIRVQAGLSPEPRHPRMQPQDKSPAPQPSAPVVSATVQWNAAVQAKRATGMSALDAVRAVNKENPGLRERMVAEANR